MGGRRRFHEEHPHPILQGLKLLPTRRPCGGAHQAGNRGRRGTGRGRARRVYRVGWRGSGCAEGLARVPGRGRSSGRGPAGPCTRLSSPSSALVLLPPGCDTSRPACGNNDSIQQCLARQWLIAAVVQRAGGRYREPVKSAATRNPVVPSRSAGARDSRIAHRTLLAPESQLPPRTTRFVPDEGPRGSRPAPRG